MCVYFSSLLLKYLFIFINDDDDDDEDHSEIKLNKNYAAEKNES